MGFSTVREIVKEVCDAIWKKIAERFKTMLHFLNCIGAIDGKHINIKCPINAGSTDYNYKRSHSIVLLSIVDADYKFVTIDAGSYGRNSNGGMFSNSIIGKKLHNKTLNIPEPTPLIENGKPLPCVFIGDEAFPLKTYLLRPYSRNALGGNEPNTIFNYRLSRSRRVVENALRWRRFRGHLEVQPELVDKIVFASCCLHMLCTDNAFKPLVESIEAPEISLLSIDVLRRNSTREAIKFRDEFKDYFISDSGRVVWQVDSVRKGRIHT